MFLFRDNNLVRFLPHLSGLTVTKMSGSYNITGSTINFVAPPYGLFLFRPQVLHLLKEITLD